MKNERKTTKPTVKNECLSKRALLIIMLFVVALLVLVLFAQTTAEDNGFFSAIDSPFNIAAVQTWREQTFWDQFWGNGIVQTSTLYTINPESANTSIVYENWRSLLSTRNNTNETQTATYSYSETIGHVVSTEISGKTEYFELAVGYSFNYAKTVSYTAPANVAPHTGVIVKAADTRIKQQYTTYKVQPQKYKSWFNLTWVNNGTAKTTTPYVNEYGCIHIDWSYIK